MRLIPIVLLVIAAIGLSGCGKPSKFKSYNGPEVTQLYLSKSERMLYLLHNTEVLKAYKVGLGFQPAGHKARSGDGRTPEGLYYIDRRNPNSRFHLSIGISYPNAYDMQVARDNGWDPGGDIFIHGDAQRRPQLDDWTAGCIAVSNEEIEDIYAMVRDGTPIYISP
ncbi:L,D-transpeptidase family protein [Qingshengfaniella alkalisoli]|uniref:L,D-transpeptidase family protein n=1 Tax=Qingshengfaniella alkalisoli TaxID=2599296 RepID=A0A5B8J0Z9_9RHOB|nr:L,D-transpeptidase family protein [Qingshengfaniella alkalisoli]QDY71443.1 L,D-transpeptidase family protein [Qingshengfaniella alkalisoli]